MIWKEVSDYQKTKYRQKKSITAFDDHSVGLYLLRICNKSTFARN